MKKVFALVALATIVVTFSGAYKAHAQELRKFDAPWYQAPITQYDEGIDLGMPAGVPITSLCAGLVVGAGFYGGGGVVTVRCPGIGDVYYQHLDRIYYGECNGAVNGCGWASYGTVLGLSGGDCNWYFYGNPCVNGFSTGSHIEVGVNPDYYGIWGPEPHPGGWYRPVQWIVSGGNTADSGQGSQSTQSNQQQSNTTGSASPANTSSQSTGGVGIACPYVLGNYVPGSGWVDCNGMFTIGPTGKCPCNSLTLIEGLSGRGDIYHYKGNEKILYEMARKHGVTSRFDRFVYTGEKIYV